MQSNRQTWSSRTAKQWGHCDFHIQYIIALMVFPSLLFLIFPSGRESLATVNSSRESSLSMLGCDVYIWRSVRVDHLNSEGCPYLGSPPPSRWLVVGRVWSLQRSRSFQASAAHSPFWRAEQEADVRSHIPTEYWRQRWTRHVCCSTSSRDDNVPRAPASTKEFCTRSRPRLATNTFRDCELSGMTMTGAPASMSSRILDARCGCSLSCTSSRRKDIKRDQSWVESQSEDIRLIKSATC